MSTTVNVICFRGKKLSNGESPIMIRICKDRKTKYKSLGISVKPDYWDFNKNQPKTNCPNRVYIEKIIIDKKSEYQKKILELKAEEKEFTASTLIKPKVRQTLKTVQEFYNELVQEMELAGKIGNSRVYKDSLRSLEVYYKNKLDIPFSDIDMEFLLGYEKFLRLKDCKENSMNLYFRTLRSTYNKAIERKHAKRETYPFDDFKVSKFSIKTEKRAISKDNVKVIMNTDLSKEKEYVQLSRDLFVFSYLCGGISFSDMANLKQSNITNDRLMYVRQKTHRKINVPISDEAKEIIKKYIDSNNEYIFPILNHTIHKTKMQQYNRKKKVILKVNRYLKKISQITSIEVNLTTYVSRHSYATVLKNSGVNIALIGETLGHSDLKTTQIYLDSFENSQIDEAMKNLL
ncbi:site-specific integrase [Dysgonomonas sp. 521]|uniref:site-specific integrase n=1 Tax=Dysgonomonas sp. 521 TaxID=2302932 RepID=UPI0013D190CC|nr:site-specific integrase [Dysgonomonas sp. 521]NDV96732.1 site-specific integrase [Dysgonomonas sp. 521]